MATKSLFLVAGAVAQLYGSTPPNGRPPAEQLREQRGIERIIPRIFVLNKLLVWLWPLLELSVLVAMSDTSPPALARILRHFLPTSPHLASPSPFFIAGTLLTLTGALLRAHCYHALGHRFTFELAIRPTHALVTHGAYSVVRHPSYTGLLLLAIGWLLCVLDPRGVVVALVAGVLGIRTGSQDDSERMMMMMSVLACAWVTAFVVLYVGMNARMNKEDAMLEENFGEAWRAWTERVPRRLIPGIY